MVKVKEQQLHGQYQTEHVYPTLALPEITMRQLMEEVCNQCIFKGQCNKEECGIN